MMVSQQSSGSSKPKKYVAIRGNTARVSVLDSEWGRRKKEIRFCTFDSDFFHVPVDTLIVEKIPITEVVEVTEFDKTSAKKFGSVLTRGLLGFGVFGAVGAAAGVLSAKPKNSATFGVRLRDGRFFIGSSDSCVLTRLKAFMFSYKPNGDVRLLGEPKITTEDQTLKLTAALAIFATLFAAMVVAFLWYR